MKENGMLSPRSGELFQTTRMGPGKVTEACSRLTLAGLFVASEGQPLGWLFAAVGIPFAVPALAVDELVASPLVDLACLPYDLCRPNHGFYIRLVDEDGKPVPNLQVSGGICNAAAQTEFFETSVSGKTDAAGEVFVGRLFNLKGRFEVNGPGCMMSFRGKTIDLAKATRESDGRLVCQYVVQRYAIGEWRAKRGISRDEVLALLPGKWSADGETRKYLKAEIGYSGTEDSGKHCFTLDASGTVVSKVPENYRDARYIDDAWAWRDGDKLKVWLLTDNRKVIRSNLYSCLPKDLQWAVLLREDVKSRWCQNVFFLGEDEKGIFLMPYFGGEGCHDIVLKFRRVQ